MRKENLMYSSYMMPFKPRKPPDFDALSFFSAFSALSLGFLPMFCAPPVFVISRSSKNEWGEQGEVYE